MTKPDSVFTFQKKRSNVDKTASFETVPEEEDSVVADDLDRLKVFFDCFTKCKKLF